MKNLPKSLFLNKNAKNIPLIIHGQGVFYLKHIKNTSHIVFSFNNKNNNLFIKFNQNKVVVFNANTKETYIDKNNSKGLINNDDATYWFSLDSQNQILRAGIGEARLDTIIYEYKFNFTFKECKTEENKKYLESLTNIQAENFIHPNKLIRDPIVLNIPLKVKVLMNY